MAKNKHNNNANIGFEKQLWDAACVLWGHIPAAEYRKVIVGLIFLRYISSVFDKKYQELYSYKLVFRFKGNNGILDYLNNKEIRTIGDFM